MAPPPGTKSSSKQEGGFLSNRPIIVTFAGGTKKSSVLSCLMRRPLSRARAEEWREFESLAHRSVGGTVRTGRAGAPLRAALGDRAYGASNQMWESAGLLISSATTQPSPEWPYPIAALRSVVN